MSNTRVVYSAAVDGINGIIVSVESTYASSDKQILDIIGLADLAVRESAGRVRGAAAATGISLRQGALTVNLAPANLKKEGSSFDLPILLSLLKHPELEENIFDNKCFIGELSLTGGIRPVQGALSMAAAARDNGFTEIYVPAENADEAAAALGITVYGVCTIAQLMYHLMGREQIAPSVFSQEGFERSSLDSMLDFSDVKGQESVKCAAELAAAGYHNMLMIGPPGTGKSMIASRMASIMPSLTLEEAIETTKIHSVAGMLAKGRSLLSSRPFRSPHHSVSSAGLSGGGRIPRPGEISLAHNGILFLDELPEFDKTAIEILRQPMENGCVTITRASATVSFPSSFMLLAAMNPCRCGYYGHSKKQCTCSEASRKQYISKISGPLLDRIDIHIRVGSLDYSKLSQTQPAESSQDIRKRVMRTREFARERFNGEKMDNGMPLLFNGKMNSAQIRKFCRLDESANALLKSVYETLSFSARGYDKILKLARTLADYNQSEDIKREHIAQAIQFRTLDRI